MAIDPTEEPFGFRKKGEENKSKEKITVPLCCLFSFNGGDPDSPPTVCISIEEAFLQVCSNVVPLFIAVGCVLR